MTKRPYTPTYPAELRDRGVRLFREHRSEYSSDNAVYQGAWWYALADTPAEIIDARLLEQEPSRPTASGSSIQDQLRVVRWSCRVPRILGAGFQGREASRSCATDDLRRHDPQGGTGRKSAPELPVTPSSPDPPI